jgi:hypothetical protein
MTDHDHILEAIGKLDFVFAKTMADNPHEYTTRRPENEAAYLALYDAVKEHGRPEKWGKARYRYLYPGDGWRYWTMGPRFGFIINRARVAGDHEVVLERARAAGRLSAAGVDHLVRTLPSRLRRLA